MKVLVFCPTRPDWPHVYGRSLMSIFRLRWDGPLDYHFVKGDVEGTEVERILWKYRRGREIFLRGDYDAMLTVEADIEVPEDALICLVDAGADVAYGLYVLRRGERKWNAHITVGQTKGLSVSDMPETARECWGHDLVVQGVGLGCTLIRRRVLEKLDFRLGQTTCDWYFAIDCVEKEFTQIADLAVVCGHIEAEPSPCIIWPDPDHLLLWRTEMLGGEWVKMEPGEKVEIVIDRLGTRSEKFRMEEKT